jgi:transporter family protein
MLWLTIGLVPPILWALVNHTDKFLLSKSEHKSSVDVLMVYSTLFSFIVLPILFLFTKHNLFVNWTQVGVQIIGGVLLTLGIYFYLAALFKDEASVVIPFAMLIPVFGYFMSVWLLDEILSVKQIIACSLIIFGALILSFELGEEKKIRFRYGVLACMFLSTLFQAAQGILFKVVTIENSFVVSTFWLHVGIAICGILLITFRRGLWGKFLESVRLNGRLMFGVGLVSEAVSAGAYMIRDFALLLAPAAIILTLNGYQPVFVFILGTAFTIWFPKFATEKIRLIHLVHKGVAIAIVVAGTVLIGQTLN